MSCRLRKGFTLLEMSLVLVVLALVLGGLMRPMLSHRDQLQQRQARLQLDEARGALLGYAAAHGHLPCPASLDSGGTASASSTGCTLYAGYLPVVELGLSGSLDAQGVLLDPWSKRIGYRLSGYDSDADGVADFAVPDGMRKAGLSQLQGDLKVSHWTGGDCSKLQLRASHVVAIIYSDGKTMHSSDAERLNQKAGLHFATGAYSQSSACGYDDMLQWISDSALFTQMLSAQRLP